MSPTDPDDLPIQARAAAELFEHILEDRSVLDALDPELRIRLLAAAGRVTRPDRADRRKQQKAKRRRKRDREREASEALLDQTGIRKLRDNPIFQTPRFGAHDVAEPEAPEPSEPIGHTPVERICYVCRTRIHEVHHFYDQMCLPCGDLNYAKRTPSADLSGRVALVTGARVKIGFQAAVMLLRAGCRVLVTTRFPRDAARRYAELEDFDDFADRLEVIGIDLRQVPAVEGLCRDLLSRLERLDFIINNACQTVRRPPTFYDHLMEAERTAGLLSDRAEALLAPVPATSDASSGPTSSAELSQVALLPEDTTSANLFPEGLLDADEQQVDLRRVNSWRLELAEVPTIELLEVQLVNAVAPFILNARLKPLMTLPSRDAHIVNVSAMEGQFYRILKSSRHPHTNMAKAALNMLTRTSAMDYVEVGIHMNSVDTGWVTDEDPVHHAERKREQDRFTPPLDIVDGAARIVDPIFTGVGTGKHVWGQFLKDYRPTDW